MPTLSVFIKKENIKRLENIQVAIQESPGAIINKLISKYSDKLVDEVLKA